MPALIAQHNPTSPAHDHRQEMILQYYPLVRTIAGRLTRRLPPSVELQELVQVGVLGLIDAIERFDDERGTTFKSYAEMRIRGSIVDFLRELDHVPRSVRRKANRIEDARHGLTLRLSRPPSHDELASAMDLTPAEFEKFNSDAEIRRKVSLDAPTSDEGSSPLIESLGGEDPAIEDGLINRQDRDALAYHIANLPEKERVAVTLYYMQGMNLREVGAVLGVTESRACQLRGQGIKRLNHRMLRSDS